MYCRLCSTSGGLGDAEQDGTYTSGYGTLYLLANSSGTHLMPEDTHSGTASFSVQDISGAASGAAQAIVTTGETAAPLATPSVGVTAPTNDAIVTAGGDVTVSVHADPTFLPNDSSNPLQSLSLKVTGGTGGGGDLTPDVDGNATLDLGVLPAGQYTATVAAKYTNGSGTVEVDSQPTTFYVASFTVKGGSWTPNPNCVGEISSGQAQAAFDPSSLDGGGSGPFFVIYTWTTQNVYYSQDGTSGAFEPYGGNVIVVWTQGQASTTFQAQCSDVGFYILEAQCMATVYSQSTGGVVTTFTQTCYIGGSAGDIDQSGGSGHARKMHQGASQGKVAHGKVAHRLTAHAGGGGTGHQEAPATVTFSPNSQIKLGLGAPTGNKTTITATVSPADKAGSVTFSATNADFTTPNGEVTISPSTSPSTPNASGQITLTITAASATPITPGNSGSPDCFVIATAGLGTTPLAKVPVLVLTPASVTEAPTSVDTKATNKYFVFGQTPDPGWEVNPPIRAGDVVFATHSSAPITITIKDQFGNSLDSMYDGFHVVDETLSGAANHSATPILFPDGNFASGTIIDDVLETSGITDNTTGQTLKDEEDNWEKFNDLFQDPNSSASWDNASAIRVGTDLRFVKQGISIYGISLPGIWLRGLQFNQVNNSTKHKPHGVILHVTETYQPPV